MAERYHTAQQGTVGRYVCKYIYTLQHTMLEGGRGSVHVIVASEITLPDGSTRDGMALNAVTGLRAWL